MIPWYTRVIDSSFKRRMDNILSPIIIALAVQGYKITQRIPNKNRILFYVDRNGQNEWFLLIEKYKNHTIEVSNIRINTEYIHERDLPRYFMDSITDMPQ